MAGSHAAAVGTDASAARRRLLRLLRDAAIVLVAALLVSFALRTFVVRSFYIPSASMESTLQIGDRILVNELVPNVVPLARGDVVVFRDPGTWLSEDPTAVATTPGPFDGFLDLIGLSPASSGHLIKRVIGLPGDHVTCCSAFGQVTVNGVPLEEPYITVMKGAPSSRLPFDQVVPAGSLWVMGDNRDNSRDSRYKGFVPISDVVGRAVVVSWPVAHWTWLDDYPFVFRGVSSSTG